LLAYHAVPRRCPTFHCMHCESMSPDSTAGIRTYRPCRVCGWLPWVIIFALGSEGLECEYLLAY
jgi:hypothetical protein